MDIVSAVIIIGIENGILEGIALILFRRGNLRANRVLGALVIVLSLCVAGIFVQQLPAVLLAQSNDAASLRDPMSDHIVLGADYMVTADAKFTMEVYIRYYWDTVHNRQKWDYQWSFIPVFGCEYEL